MFGGNKTKKSKQKPKAIIVLHMPRKKPKSGYWSDIGYSQCSHWPSASQLIKTIKQWTTTVLSLCKLLSCMAIIMYKI